MTLRAAGSLALEICCCLRRFFRSVSISFFFFKNKKKHHKEKSISITYHPATWESAVDGMHGVSIQSFCGSGSYEPIATTRGLIVSLVVKERGEMVSPLAAEKGGIL